MKVTKKIVSTFVAVALVAAYPLCAYAYTPLGLDSGQGTFSNVTISGTGSTVFMLNHSGSYKKCRVNIFRWGILQTGKVEFELYRVTDGAKFNHTFNGCDEVYLMDNYYASDSRWNLDAECLDTNSNRTISGDWEMS